MLFWDPLYTLGHEGLERAGIMTIDPEEDDISYLMREHTVNSPSKFFEREQFHTAEDYNARIDQVNNKVDNPILRDLFDLEKINVNSYWKSQQLLTIQTQSEILSDQLSQLYHALDAPGLFEDENWKEELEITRTARGVVAEKFIQNIEKRDDLTAHQETSE